CVRLISQFRLTRYLDRIMRPTFGNEEYIFTALSSPNLVASKIQFSLDTYLSSNIKTNVKVENFHNGKLKLVIDFRDESRGVVGNVSREFQF
ncbi:MAG: hypothetical protein ACRC80_39325, partial [Waterburya sp.]